MSKQSFRSVQFQKYCSVQPPKVIVWCALTLGAALIPALCALLISGPLRQQWGAAHVGLQQAVNVLTGVVFLVPVASGAWWWLWMGRFTQRKEAALAATFADLGWSLGQNGVLQTWPTAASSVVHMVAQTAPQVPRYVTFAGACAGSPAECVLLDARWFDSATKTAFIYLHVGLKDSYPHVLLDSKDGLFRHDLQIQTGNVVRQEFEGELHKYFTVMSAARAGSDAQYVFTPDVLQHVLDYGTGFNVEAIGNSLYIFARPEQFETAAGFASFMNLAQYLAAEFNHKSRAVPDGSFRTDAKLSEQRMDIAPRRPMATPNQNP
jgi:hypothetical protein